MSGNGNEGSPGLGGISCSLDVTISNTDVYYSVQGSDYLASIGQEALKTFQVVPKNALNRYRMPGKTGALEVDRQNNLFAVVNN